MTDRIKSRRSRKATPAIEAHHKQVIDRHKKMLAHINKQRRPPIYSQHISGPLKLTPDTLLAFKYHVKQEIFRFATLRPEMQFFECSQAAKDSVVFELANTYGQVIGWAVGEFADVLVQTVLAKTSRRDISETLRGAVWVEALKFADELIDEGVWSSWLRIPLTAGPKGTWTQEEKQAFSVRVDSSRRQWLMEADRRINIRLLLRGAKQSTKRVEHRRTVIARLMHEKPGSSDSDLCLRIDSLNEARLNRQSGLSEEPIPVPRFLKDSNFRLWSEAFGDRKDLAQKMHVYLSKIRKEFGLSRAS